MTESPLVERRVSPGRSIGRALITLLGRTRLVGLLVAALFAVSALKCAEGLSEDVDVYWLAAGGRSLLENGDVPRANVWSFVDGHVPWVMHEWLFGVAYAVGLRALGPAVFVLLGVLFGAASTLVFVRQTLAQPRAAAAGNALALLGVAIYGSGLLGARPTWAALLFPLVMVAVAFARTFTWRTFGLAVALEFVWANAHGSFPLGVMLLLAGAAEHGFERRRLLASIASAVATFVNPYGWQLHRLVVDYALGSHGRLRGVSAGVLEYAPAWQRFDLVPHLGLVALSGIAIVALVRRRHVARAVMTLILVVQAVLHVRHTVLAGLLACILLEPVFAEWLDAGAEERSASAVAATVVAPGLVLALVVFAARFVREPADAWLGPAPFAAATARLARALPDRAHVFVPFPFAALVIWEAGERGVQIFYDPRNDCYSEEMIDKGLRFKDGLVRDREVTDVFEREGVLFALTPSAAALTARFPEGSAWRGLGSVAEALDASGGWRVTAEDRGVRVYARR